MPNLTDKIPGRARTEAMRTIGSRKTHAGSAAFFMVLTAVTVLGNSMLAKAQSAGNDSMKTRVIVKPKFGGQILGYDIDRNGTEGLVSEYVSESDEKNRVAVEKFDQTTGAIIEVVAEENHTANDFVVQEINANGLGLVLFQKSGQNHFFTLNPYTANKFTGVWTPPVKSSYQLAGISVARSGEVALFENDLNAGLAEVFSSNVSKNTFGRPVSLASIIDGDEFLVDPVMALGRTRDEVVLADSADCPVPEPACATRIALVEVKTGTVAEFTDNLGVGQVNGLAVDPVKGIAVTTTLGDMGVEFYNLAKKTGFEKILPNATSEIQAGLDVEFDPLHKLFLVAQYTSTGNINDPQPRVYAYDEEGNVVETITTLPRIPLSPTTIVLNPSTRTGFLPVIDEPQNFPGQLESFTY
jgi:hypothetical protein